MSVRFALVTVSLLLAGCNTTAGPEANLKRLSVSVPTAWRMTLCHGFECTYRETIRFSRSDIARLERLMGRPASPEAERERLSRALQWFETRAGVQAGTAADKGGLNFRSGVAGQQDCIDESTTTTNFMLVLQEHGLLRHHTVGGVAARGFLLDGRYPHATATLTERTGGRQWSIDTWVRDNGEPPVIMPLEEWMAQRRSGT